MVVVKVTVTVTVTLTVTVTVTVGGAGAAVVVVVVVDGVGGGGGCCGGGGVQVLSCLGAGGSSRVGDSCQDPAHIWFPGNVTVCRKATGPLVIRSTPMS